MHAAGVWVGDRIDPRCCVREPETLGRDRLLQMRDGDDRAALTLVEARVGYGSTDAFGRPAPAPLMSCPQTQVVAFQHGVLALERCVLALGLGQVMSHVCKRKADAAQTLGELAVLGQKAGVSIAAHRPNTPMPDRSNIRRSEKARCHFDVARLHAGTSGAVRAGHRHRPLIWVHAQ
jgi:hypothetical protein